MTTLTPDIESRVRSIVAAGGYASEHAVLAEALELLEKREQLRCMIDVGLAELDRGEGLDGEAVFRELKARTAEIDRQSRP